MTKLFGLIFPIRQYGRLIIGLIAILVVIIFIGNALSVWIGARGPFIFADEAEYAEMTRVLLAGDFLISGHTQYGPLFPILLALIHLMTKLNFYASGALINLTCWIGSVALSFHLIRLIGGTRYEQWAGAYLMLIAPFWSFGVATWADPLFYLLFYVSLYFLILSLRKNRMGYRVILGVALGLLFIAKPIGIFYVIALIVVTAFAIYRQIKPISGSWFPLTWPLQISISSMFIIIPWMFRNWLECGSLLGYNYASHFLKLMLVNQGWRSIGPLIYSVAYQVSYLIFLSFGFLGIIIYCFVRWEKSFTVELWASMLYLLVSSFFLVCVSALHMTPNPSLGFWIPNGRYLTQLGPLLIPLGFIMLRQVAYSRRNYFHIHMACLFLFQAFFLLLATPLKVLAPYSLINNPDLGLMFIWDIFRYGPFIQWRGFYEPEPLQLLVSVLVLLPTFILTTKMNPGGHSNRMSRMIFPLILLLVWGGSIIQYKGISMMQSSQTPLNNLFRKASFLCGKNIYFDKNLDLASIEFMHIFWCSTKSANTVSLVDFINLKDEEEGFEPMFVTRLGNALMPYSQLLPVLLESSYIVLRQDKRVGR